VRQDDDRILEEGDDPAPTKAVRAKQDVDVEAALHQGGPVDVGPGACAGLLAFCGVRGPSSRSSCTSALFGSEGVDHFRESEASALG
jgi:hypothetical protein